MPTGHGRDHASDPDFDEPREPGARRFWPERRVHEPQWEALFRTHHVVIVPRRHFLPCSYIFPLSFLRKRI